MVNDLDFENKLLHYTAPTDPNVDHAASEIMESTLLFAGTQELWENDIVKVPTLLGLSSMTGGIEWNFNRWIIRDVAKKTIKEITQSGLKTYQIIGHIYL